MLRNQNHYLQGDAHFPGCHSPGSQEKMKPLSFSLCCLGEMNTNRLYSRTNTPLSIPNPRPLTEGMGCVCKKPHLPALPLLSPAPGVAAGRSAACQRDRRTHECKLPDASTTPCILVTKSLPVLPPRPPRAPHPSSSPSQSTVTPDRWRDTSLGALSLLSEHFQCRRAGSGPSALSSPSHPGGIS